MDATELLTRYDQQQRIDIEYPGTRKEILPEGVVRFVRPAPGMNFVHYSRLDPAVVDSVIQAQIDYFSPLGQPFSWHVLGHDAPPDLPRRLAAHGFQPDPPGALMVLDLDTASAALFEPLMTDVRAIKSRAELEAVIAVEAEVWSANSDWMRHRLGDHLQIPDYLDIYVAYADGRPACAGWVYFSRGSQFGSLFGGSTMPAYRGRGLYTAVLAARARAARRRGYRFLCVDANPMSQPIVARHGFRQLTHTYDYVWTGQRPN